MPGKINLIHSSADYHDSLRRPNTDPNRFRDFPQELKDCHIQHMIKAELYSPFFPVVSLARDKVFVNAPVHLLVT